MKYNVTEIFASIQGEGPAVGRPCAAKVGESMHMVDCLDGTRYMARIFHNLVQVRKFERYLTTLWHKRGIVWE